MEGMHMKVLRWNARGATLPALALLAMLPYSTAVAQTSYTLTIITTTNSSANGINVNGDIVGQNVFSGGDTEAFLFKNGKVIELQIPPNPHAPGFAPPPTFPVAQSVNDSDVVVGSGSVGIGQNPRPFIWQPGQTVGTDIGVLANNCVSVKAQGVNNPGQIVGTGTQCLPNPNVGWFLAKGQTTPTLLPTLGGVSTAAFGVNDLGQVVGDSALDANAQTIHAFVWQLGTGIRDLGVLPGGTFSNAVAINKNGVAVGASTFNGGTAATGDRHAVVFQNGLVTDLDPNLPSGFDSFANAINGSGQIVGDSAGRAFVWTNGVGTDLNTLIAPTTFRLIEATGINDKGQITGLGAVSGSRTTQVYLLTPQ
jgi:probable HAF family extracellular repeat protein